MAGTWRSEMSGPEGSDLQAERRGAIGWILLGPPDGVHTIGEAFPTRLEGAVEKLSEGGGLRAVVLTGRSKVFCAGADLKPADRLREPEFGRLWLEAQLRTLLSFARIRVPMVAAVEGTAFDAGSNLDLALACDFIVAARSASFCPAFAKVGLATDVGSPYLLPRKVGLQRGKELMYTGRTIDDKLVENDAEAHAEALASQLAAACLGAREEGARSRLRRHLGAGARRRNGAAGSGAPLGRGLSGAARPTFHGE